MGVAHHTNAIPSDLDARRAISSQRELTRQQSDVWELGRPVPEDARWTLVSLVAIPQPVSLEEWVAVNHNGRVEVERVAKYRRRLDAFLAAGLVEEVEPGLGRYQPTRAGHSLVAQWYGVHVDSLGGLSD